MDTEKRLARLESIVRNLQMRLSDIEKENAGLVYRLEVSQSAVVESTLKHIQSQLDKLEKQINNLSYRVDENFTEIAEIKKTRKKQLSDGG